MDKRQGGKETNKRLQVVRGEALRAYILLGRRLAAQMAESNFRSITSEAGWTAEEVEAATEYAVSRMHIGARDLLSEKGANHGSGHWQVIWEAMERGYRETTATLLRDETAWLGMAPQ